MDLINQKFGKLTVIKKTDQRDSSRRILWLCECECGKQRIVDTSSLKNGKTYACEQCAKIISQEKRKNTLSKNIKNNLTGKTFGRLTVLEPTLNRTKDRCIIWRCRCECGKECEVSSKSLTQGNTKSCGCLNIETRATLGHANKKDLVGQKFGKLLVIKDSGERLDNNVLWLCLCDCGNEIKIKGTSLLHGTESCGCISSKGEEKIATILRENNIPFEIHKRFDTCKFDNGYYAYFDFYVDNKYLIEYDGLQHFTARQGGWNTEDNLKKTQIRDKFKNQWCKENNIPLIRIPYTKLKTLTIDDLVLPQPVHTDG